MVCLNMLMADCDCMSRDINFKTRPFHTVCRTRKYECTVVILHIEDVVFLPLFWLKGNMLVKFSKIFPHRECSHVGSKLCNHGIFKKSYRNNHDDNTNNSDDDSSSDNKHKSSPLGTIVALWMGWAPSVKIATSAWPPSWYAVSFLFFSEITADFLSAPMMILSFACSRSEWLTALLFSLAAFKAATLTKFARSAPLKPGVPLAMTCKL